MNRVIKTIGLDYATSRHIYGAGTTVAILDTGIHANHPDFHGSHTPLIAFYDCINRQTTPYDDNGHGTHVSGSWHNFLEIPMYTYFLVLEFVFFKYLNIIYKISYHFVCQYGKIAIFFQQHFYILRLAFSFFHL